MPTSDVAMLLGAFCVSALALALSKALRERTFALAWTFGMRRLVHRSLRDYRDNLLARAGGLHGRVLEVGAGDGAHLAFLCGPAQPNVREVVCVEPNPAFHGALRKTMAAAKAQSAAAGIEVDLRLFAGTLRELVDAEPHSRFDAIATWLVLCSVPDPVESSVRDCARLLATGGKLLYMEHVAATSAALRLVQRLVQPVWTLMGDGCQLCRETHAALAAVGAEKRWTVVHHEAGAVFGGLLPVVCGVCEACTPRYEVRRAEAADADAIARVWFAAYRDDPGTHTLDAAFLAERTLARFRPRVDGELQSTLVACEPAAGTLVGFCMVRPDEVYQFFLAAEARGTGLADELMAAALQLLRGRGSTRAFLYCFPANARGRRFYERNGWQWEADESHDVEISGGRASALHLSRYGRVL